MLSWSTLGSSAKRHGSTSRSELCSILNNIIRKDDSHDTIHAAVFAHAINMELTRQKAAPWLQKLFPESYPCVNVERLMSHTCNDIDNQVLVQCYFLSTKLRFSHVQVPQQAGDGVETEVATIRNTSSEFTRILLHLARRRFP